MKATLTARVANPNIPIDPINPVSEDFLRNPYPFYKSLRDADPIFWSETGGYWLVTGYDACQTILMDNRFGKHLDRWEGGSWFRKTAIRVARFLNIKQDSMLNQDQPDHTRIRQLVNKAFTPSVVESLRPKIEETVDRLIDDMIARGTEADLIADFAFPLPITVIADMLGVPSADREKFKSWSARLAKALEPAQSHVCVYFAVFKAAQEFREYLKPLIENRRQNPENDLISSLVAARENDDKLSESELISNIMLLLGAGHETTVNLIANSFLALAEHPREAALVKADAGLIPSCIEECLRFDSPVQMVRRLATCDVEIMGHLIRKGELVNVLLGAANHDPLKFDDPDQFKIQRSGNKHLSFGQGIHHCLGATLARVEAEIALRKLFQRLPEARPALGRSQLVYREPFMLRGVTELPIVTGACGSIQTWTTDRRSSNVRDHYRSAADGCCDHHPRSCPGGQKPSQGRAG